MKDIIRNKNLDWNKEAAINRADLDKILDQSKNPSLMSEGRETVVWNKDSLVNIIN